MWDDDDDDDAEGNFGDKMNEDDQLDDATYVDDQDEDGDVGTQNQLGASGGDDGDGAGERGDAAEDDTRTTVSRKRRRQVNFVFTPAQERELAEWYRAYPLFYDKKTRM